MATDGELVVLPISRQRAAGWLWEAQHVLGVEQPSIEETAAALTLLEEMAEWVGEAVIRRG